MSTTLLFFVFRFLVAGAVLVVVGRLTFPARAYRSWRVYPFFFLATLCFSVAAGLRALPLLSLTSNPFAAPVFETLFGIGVIGVLWENLIADRLRYKDSRKLMDQWRLASNLAQKRARELETFSEIAKEMAGSLDLRKVLQTLVDHALRLGDADAVTVFVLNRETGELVNYRVIAATSDQLRQLPPPRPNGLTATVAQSGEAAFIADTRSHPLFAEGLFHELRSVASLPLRLEDEVVGVINVAYARPHGFDDEDMRLLNSLASAAALAVHNAALHERIARLAVTDELTGLANRRRFLEAVRSEMQRARRYGRPLTVAMVDLDRLKQINDQNGHAAGDAMLRGVALCLRANVRDTDVPARLGGDEFAVLFPETGQEVARSIAERIRAAVESFSAAVDGVTIRSTVSIGLVSRSPGDLHDLPSLIHLADEALYKAKTEGRNAVSSLDASLAQRPTPGD